MRLSPRDARILYALQFRGKASVVELSKLTGFPTHVIHYSLKKFEEARLLRAWAFLDMSALGYEEDQIYFSLAGAAKNTRRGLLQYLKEHARVIWLAELGGDFQFALTLASRSVLETSTFFEEMNSKFGGLICKKLLARLISFDIFPKKYLTPAASAKDEGVGLRMKTGRVELDALDWKILGGLYNPHIKSNYDLSRSLGTPRATVEYRLKQLEKSGVIMKYINFIDAHALGRQIFKLLIYAHGLGGALRERLYAFCKKEPEVVNLTHSLGSWDFEIGLEVEDVKRASAMAETLYDKFPALIDNIAILPVISQTNSVKFLGRS